MGTVARTRAKTLNLPVWKPAVASWDGGDAPSPHVCRSGLSQVFLRSCLSAVNSFCGSPVGGCLDAVQLGVRTAPEHEVVVRADLDDVRAIEYHDEVSHARGAEPV